MAKVVSHHLEATQVHGVLTGLAAAQAVPLSRATPAAGASPAHISAPELHQADK